MGSHPVSDEVILAHGQMVVSIARFYRKKAPYPVDLRDLVQIGWCGFLAGLKRWDPTKGYTVGAFCKVWVRGAIHRQIFAPRKLWEHLVVGRHQLITPRPGQSDTAETSRHTRGGNDTPHDESREAEAEQFLLADLLECLPVDSREIVRRLYLERETPAKIARSLGVLVGDVLAQGESAVNWLRAMTDPDSTDERTAPPEAEELAPEPVEESTPA